MFQDDRACYWQSYYSAMGLLTVAFMVIHANSTPPPSLTFYYAVIQSKSPCPLMLTKLPIRSILHYIMTFIKLQPLSSHLVS